VSTENQLYEGHKHFVSGAGWSEHCLFIRALLAKETSQPIPLGTLSAAAKKRTKKRPQAKRSAKMKAMLRAPEALSSGVAGAEAVEVVPMNSQTQELLPGGLVEGKELPILDSVGQEKESMCMAATNSGKRCRRKRSHGAFCFHHHQIASSPKWSLTLFESVKEPAQSAMESWEKAQLDLAIQLSQTENEELSARMQESCRRVDARLRLLGLRRVPVPAEGNCQFDALVYSADVPMSAMEMRSFVVQYLRPLARFFQDRTQGQFAGRYDSYCSNLAKSGS